jgi:aspartate/methionine/tyrosine aminotransferase
VGNRLAASLERLGTETAFSVLARAKELERQGRDVIHLQIGEPDFDTPRHVAEAAFAAIRAGHTHYCPSAGLPELREACAGYLSRTRGVAVAPERVLIANGAKPFLFFTILATCDPGDEVVYPDPGFPIYESAIRWAGAVPVALPVRGSTTSSSTWASWRRDWARRRSWSSSTLPRTRPAAWSVRRRPPQPRS